MQCWQSIQAVAHVPAAALLPMGMTINGQGKAAQNVSSTWGPITLMGDPNEDSDFGLSLCWLLQTSGE